MWLLIIKSIHEVNDRVKLDYCLADGLNLSTERALDGNNNYAMAVMINALASHSSH